MESGIIYFKKDASTRTRAPGAPIIQWCLGWLDENDWNSESKKMQNLKLDPKLAGAPDPTIVD
eukprot:SAG31_NODE_627_length_13445_cov_18.311053_13_plen_62_part_01